MLSDLILNKRIPKSVCFMQLYTVLAFLLDPPKRNFLWNHHCLSDSSEFMTFYILVDNCKI